VRISLCRSIPCTVFGSTFYKVGILHERVEKNPVEHVETRSQSLYKAVVITPSQTLAILNKLTNPLHFTLVLTCAATALRASELVSLRWSDILWNDGQIRVSKRWAKGDDGETKTAASNGYVPMHPVLAEYLKEWRAQSPYSKVDDFVFPWLVKDGKVPISASMFVKDHLRTAAVSASLRAVLSSVSTTRTPSIATNSTSMGDWRQNMGVCRPTREYFRP